jgi:hypothetical protein
MPFGHGPINQIADTWRKVLFRLRLDSARTPTLVSHSYGSNFAEIGETIFLKASR